MPLKFSPLQAAGDVALTDTNADDAPIMGVKPDAWAGTVDNTGDSCSARARSVTLHVPLYSTTTERPKDAATLSQAGPPLQPPSVPNNKTPIAAEIAENGLRRSDPNSSFDLAFDFNPEALEAAMKPYD